jgi:hypothetical protein
MQQTGQKSAPLHRGLSVEEIDSLMSGSKREILSEILLLQLEDEAYEHASVTRQKIRECPSPDEESFSESIEGVSEKEVAEIVFEKYSLQEVLSIAQSLLRKSYQSLSSSFPRVAEWINCSIWQIDGTIDSIEHGASPPSSIS